MMFEAQITAIHRTEGEEEDEEEEERDKDEEEVEGTYLVSECGDIISKHLATDNAITKDKIIEQPGLNQVSEWSNPI